MSAALVCPLCHTTYSDESLEFCRKDGARLRPRSVLGARWRGRIVDDRYEVTRFLGAGGMAEVYEARRLADDARLALKLMRPQISEDPSMVARFRREARLVGLIDHPNVVQVHGFGTLEDGVVYMAMELLEGESLEDLLEGGPIDLGLALEVAAQASDGIHAAHEKGIVHRDIKPANIFVQQADGKRAVKVQVKVLDLGIAKLLDDRESNLTATGMVFGSPEYMSPEQALGKQVDARADIYSFGVVVYHACTGSVPFHADSFVGVLTKHVTVAPEWPEQVARERGLPAGLKPVIMKALAKNPDHRHQTMLELRDALREVCREAAAAPRREPEASITKVEAAEGGRPGSVRRTTLAGAGGDLDREVVEIAPDTFWVGRREGVFLERNVYLRVYRGNGMQINVLIDPGPTQDLSTVAAKVRPIIGPLEKVDIVFLNHQDPDVAGNAPVIQELNPQAHVICSEDTWRLARFYGLRSRSYSATEHFPGMRTTLGTGHEVQFVPSPYCHFRGAVMYYDRSSRVLFSGDLFGGLSRTIELVAGEASCPGVEIFHQLYMPSRRALRSAVERVRRLDPPPLAIAPQHGAIIGGELMESVLARIAELPVGAELLDRDGDAGRAVAAFNAVIDAVVARVGQEQTAAELRCFSADGTFPNLFVFADETRIGEIKIEPRAAVRALLERVRARVPGEEREAFEREVDRILVESNLQAAPDADGPYLEYTVG